MPQLSTQEVNSAIRNRFRTKRRDIPPFTGWLKPSTRNDLADLMGEMGGFEKGAEIGVSQGTNAREFLHRIPKLHLTCVDPWTKYANWTQERMNRIFERAKKRLSNYTVDIKRMTSVDGAKTIKNGSLDFVYIDGFHDFDWVMIDLILWSPKVRSGGIVAGHDYYQFYRGGVVTAVDAYVKAHNITTWYVTRESEPTFFWVKK